jgi:hypothetical protein
MYSKPKRLVTIDLDSTLCNTGHRHHMIDRVNGTDWNAYSLACVDDLPIMGMVRTAQLLAALPDVEVHALSGRNAVAAQQTLAWLQKHDVPITTVHLADHGNKDYHPGWTHADYKLARLQEVERETGMKVILHFDDYAEVAHKLEEAGYPCVCVRTPQDIEEIVAEDRLRDSL